jgi:hypothetical protein
VLPLVSACAAYLILLRYKRYREEQQALHDAWVERQKEREAKIARGEKVGPAERDPTEQVEVGVLGLLKFIVYTVIIIALAGKFITGSYTWEYESKWTRLKTYLPVCPTRVMFPTFVDATAQLETEPKTVLRRPTRSVRWIRA